MRTRWRSKSACRMHLGMRVAIDHGDNGGSIEIRYKTLEQLDSMFDEAHRLDSSVLRRHLRSVTGTPAG